MTSDSVRFRYRATDPVGRIVKGEIVGSDPSHVVRRLLDDGLSALEVTPAQEPMHRRSISVRDLAIVFRNVATLVASGVPVERAFAVSEELVSGSLSGRLREVRRMVREGSTVADALGSMPGVFPRAVVGVIDAGERGSALGVACASVADQLESEAELRSQLRSALAYPALILVMGLATVGVMAGVVIPRFAVVLSELGAELPATTQALLTASEIFKRAVLPALVLTVLAIPVARAWLRNEHLRLRVDRVLLSTPVLGSLRLGFATARTCRALGGMLGNGLPLLAALDSAKSASGDREMTRRIECARDAVARGKRLTHALAEERALTPLAIQFVGIGEAGSSLGEMLVRAGDLAADRTQRRVRAAVTLLEPLLVIVLGVVVAATAAALLQAVYSVRPS